jgi:hypothetical protein
MRTLTARLENDHVHVYDESDLLIGKLQTGLNFNESEIILSEQKFRLIRDGWNTKILEGSIEKLHLKTSAWSGNTNVVETGQKITGVWGSKWSTALIDATEHTLLKIRNEKSLVTNNKYEIEVSDQPVSDFDILLALYGHLYGSSMKQMGAIGA